MGNTTRKTSSELRGQLTGEASPARERIAQLFDSGTFVELGAFVKRAQNENDKLFGAKDDGSEFESVICGYGAVDGRLTFAFAQDESKMKGALTSAHAKKICDILDRAFKCGAPVVGMYASSGAVLTEGTAALAGYGKILGKLALCRGIIPVVSVICGVCAGSAAAIAAMGDIMIATNKSSLYVNPPFILKAKFKDSDAGTASKGEANGIIDICASDDADAMAKTRELLRHLPSSSDDETACDATNDDMNRQTPEAADMVAGDVKALIKTVSDESFFIETGETCAPELVSGFIQLAGMTVGVVANQPTVKEGRLTPIAADKASKFIGICDSFNIPLLTLVNTAGFDVTDDSENAPYASSLANLAESYALSESPKVTVVAGSAYGGAFTFMGSKSLGTDVNFALDSAKISVMPADAALQFVSDGKNKAEFEASWYENMESPLSAAREGEIDDIIATEELRQRVIAAFEMLING